MFQLLIEFVFTVNKNDLTKYLCACAVEESLVQSQAASVGSAVPPSDGRAATNSRTKVYTHIYNVNVIKSAKVT